MKISKRLQIGTLLPLSISASILFFYYLIQESNFSTILFFISIMATGTLLRLLNQNSSSLSKGKKLKLVFYFLTSILISFVLIGFRAYMPFFYVWVLIANLLMALLFFYSLFKK
jgi:type III secretory pathway component EscR